jgi:uncharacterized protein YjiS (DUF1127 family)
MIGAWEETGYRNRPEFEMSWSERARTFGAYSLAFASKATAAADAFEKAILDDARGPVTGRLPARDRTLTLLRQNAELWEQLARGFRHLARKMDDCETPQRHALPGV